MTLVSELELPAFDYTDESIRGERFHEEMAAVRAKGWLAEGPYGYIALDRDSAEFFLRTRAAIFPGMKIAEIFGVSEGPLYEQMKRNILHINGPDHTRLRSLVNPALSPRAVERYRPVMKELLAGLLAQVTATPNGSGGRCRCEFVEAFAKPYPSLAIATVMGALLADPSLAEAAVEEALRYEPITPFTARLTTEEIVWRDVTFPEGTLVGVCAFTGNRDLEEEATGAGGVDAFDITAERGRARALT